MNFNIFKRKHKQKIPEKWVTPEQIQRMKKISKCLKSILESCRDFDEMDSRTKYMPIVRLAHNARPIKCIKCPVFSGMFRSYNCFGGQPNFKHALNQFLDHFENDHKDLIEANQK